MNQLARREADAAPSLIDIPDRMSARCDRQEVSGTVRLILGRYNQKPQGDPDLYVRQMTALLAGYPAEIVRAFQDPSSDPLPASDFLPSVATVKDAADRLLAGMRRILKIYNHYHLAREIETGPSKEERSEVGKLMHDLVKSLKFGPMPENASPARKVHAPEWLWDENEQSSEHKRVTERLRQTQCAPGEAIRESELVKQQHGEQGNG